MHAFEKLTTIVDGERRIISDPPLIVPIDELTPPTVERDAIEDEIHDLIRSYRRTLETDRRHLLEQFRFVDLARKVVGVGSVGTRAWIALLLGSTTTIRCSYNSRRRSRPCWSGSSGRASTPTPASGSSPASD